MYKPGQSGNLNGRPKGARTEFFNVAKRMKDIDPDFDIVKFLMDIARGLNPDLDTRNCRMQAAKMLFDKSTLNPRETDELPAITITPGQMLKLAVEDDNEKQ